jgi:polysaccharide export outer membrane protein
VVAACAIAWACLLATGCRTEPPRYESFADEPIVPTRTEPFRVGETVTVSFAGDGIQTHPETIAADGTIDLPLLGKVVAAGKTPDDLQIELQEKYSKISKVPFAIPDRRFYYVSGEVRKPGPEPYLGETDIIKAIAAASDFTDTADKRNVTLIRAGGQKEIIDVQNIVDGKADTVPVYPGDRIEIKRR